MEKVADQCLCGRLPGWLVPVERGGWEKELYHVRGEGERESDNYSEGALAKQEEKLNWLVGGW